MSQFTRTVPKDSAELFGFLVKLHDNKRHLVSVGANSADSRIEIDLSQFANSFGGYPDVYFPIRRGKLVEASALVSRIRAGSDSGFPPTLMDAENLFLLIDPTPQ
ncbi:MAG: hypothetical protein EXR75_12560 [Myxococcales bacterium]|nr:hypothetical protein [Myxococcales bacterium]